MHESRRNLEMKMLPYNLYRRLATFKTTNARINLLISMMMDKIFITAKLESENGYVQLRHRQPGKKKQSFRP